MRTLNLPPRNVPFKRTAEMGIDKGNAVGPKTSIITNTKTHVVVVPEQTCGGGGGGGGWPSIYSPRRLGRKASVM